MNILYCRVGWMEAYKGNSDERPIGGGSYNKNEIGYEIYNQGTIYQFTPTTICSSKKGDFLSEIVF